MKPLISIVLLIFSFLPIAYAQAPTARLIQADVTAYTSDPAETWGDGTITASGTTPHEGTLACPREFPFGTQFIIKGKEYVCEDRMAKKFNDRFDIWVRTKKEAFEWGKRNVVLSLSTP